MLSTGRFREFISAIVMIRNEEVEDQTLWEYWLHKDFERTFQEFREAMSAELSEETSEEDLCEIVRQSQEILAGVLPKDAGNDERRR